MSKAERRPRARPRPPSPDLSGAPGGTNLEGSFGFSSPLAGSGCLRSNLADVGDDPLLLRAEPVDPLLRPGLRRQRGLGDHPAVVKRAIIAGARIILLAPGDEVGPHRRADLLAVAV